MSAEQAFLQEIVEDPDDDAVRLIYADWLEDHGNAPRAEFIRTQIELAGMKEDDPRREDFAAREADLLAEHEAEWVGPLCERLLGWYFKRGFLDDIHVEAENVLKEDDRLL